MEKKRCTAIVLAAGQGKRMGTKTQKQYLNLCGYPVLWHCLHTFEESAVIDDMILVTGEDQIDYCRTEFVEKYGFRKICKIVAGGAERYHSVLNGLRAMEKNACEDGYVSPASSTLATTFIVPSAPGTQLENLLWKQMLQHPSRKQSVMCWWIMRFRR